MDRTLYLRACSGLKVRRDGPSLWIREPGKAGRRVPARLISRVVVIGNLRIETDAIALFAEHGAPVTFMAGSGELKAVALAPDLKPSTLRDRQRVLVEDDDAREKAMQWLECRRKRHCLELLRALAPALAREVECTGFRWQDYDLMLRVFFPADGAGTGAVRSAVTGLLHELILSLISRAGLDPHCGVLHRRENFGLCRDFLVALGPEADRQTMRFFDGPHAAAHVRREGKNFVLSNGGCRAVISRFENCRQRIAETIDGMLDEYFRLLREA